MKAPARHCDWRLPRFVRNAEKLKHIERVINTADYDYWIDCDECLKVCPNNR